MSTRISRRSFREHQCVGAPRGSQFSALRQKRFDFLNVDLLEPFKFAVLSMIGSSAKGKT